MPPVDVDLPSLVCILNYKKRRFPAQRQCLNYSVRMRMTILNPKDYLLPITLKLFSMFCKDVMHIRYKPISGKCAACGKLNFNPKVLGADFCSPTFEF